MSDEKGQYRIGGLAPGKYHIRASSVGEFFQGRPEIRTDGTTEVHNASTYYPGVAAEAEAGKVDVRAGTETTGIDIQLVKVPFVRVSGHVVDAPKNGRASIMISQGNSGTGTELKRDGSFTIWRLDPGTYTLSAEWDAPNGEHIRTVGVDVEVAASNIDNIELRVVPDSDISGRLEFEDDEAKQIPKQDGPQQYPQERMIMLNGTGSSFEEGSSTARIGDDGSFQLKRVAAGKYRVQVAWGTAYVKPMRLGSTSIEGPTLDLMRGAGGADLAVLMGAANSSISGTVQDANGSASDLIVVLTSGEDARDSQARYTPIKADGTYSFDHLAPGSYLIAAVSGDDLAVQGNHVIGYEGQTETVRVGARDKVTKDLKRRSPTAQ
jgi:hypothetical protein